MSRHQPSSPAIIMALLLGGLVALVDGGLPGCRRGRAGPPSQGSRPPATGLAAAHPGLAKAVRAVLADCELNEGQVQSCVGDAEQQLVEQEQAAGPSESLRSYCRGLEESFVPLRRLCAARLIRLSFPGLLARAASPALFDCLLRGLARVEPGTRPGLARSAALLAPLVGGEDRLIKRLGELGGEPEARLAALRALWANGRVGELKRLEPLLKAEQDRQVQIAVLRGFAEGGSLTASERDQVCPLLRGRLAAKDALLAATAATTYAATCPEERDALLEAAEQLADRAALSVEYLIALRAVNGFLAPRGNRQQRSRSAALLARLSGDAALPAPLREAALEHLTSIDRPAAVRVARLLRPQLPRLPASAPNSTPASAPLLVQTRATLQDQVDALLQKHP